MNKALFLDRDGVINIDHGYIFKPEDIEFVPGIFDLCKNFRSHGYLIIVVTNQSGIARGFYTENDFVALTKWMTDQFAQRQCPIDGVYYCPHHAVSGIGKYKLDCQCRKPNPGMFQQAAREHNIDFSQSVMVGDKPSDIAAANSVGINRTFFVDNQTIAPEKLDDFANVVTKLSQITVGFS